MSFPASADVAPWRDWPTAASGALQFLHEHTSWDAWLVTRVLGDRQVVLCAVPAGVLRPGSSFPWQDTYCRQMVTGAAPRVATVTAAVPAYVGRQPSGVAAYVGVPLLGADLELFGTLCAVAFRARPRSAARDLPLAEGMARMLSTLLAAGMGPEEPTV